MKKEALIRNIVDVDSFADLSSDYHPTSQLFFKHDKLYKHRLLRINYTTYEIRQAQDIINPNTPHLDIMVLKDSSCDEPAVDDEIQRFLYARVLGIYHVNVVFTGPGSIDHQPRRMEFLWVRWFQPSPHIGWDSRRMDCIKFFPVEDEYAFGFLDPSDVLRACHLLPRQALGMSTSIGLSKLAKDKEDWQCYYVNRYPTASSLLLFMLIVVLLIDLLIGTCLCDFTGG